MPLTKCWPLQLAWLLPLRPADPWGLRQTSVALSRAMLAANPEWYRLFGLPKGWTKHVPQSTYEELLSLAARRP